MPPIHYVLRAVKDFTGSEWEQEDDITLVALERLLMGALAASDSDDALVLEPAFGSKFRTFPVD